MPRLILVKIDTDAIQERLAAAVMTGHDPKSDMVVIQEPLVLQAGEEATIVVPRVLCYEFDQEALQDVNGLVGAAVDKLDVAHKIMRMALTPVDMQDDGPPVDVVLH